METKITGIMDTQDAALKRKLVLVVDDSEAVREHICSLLKDEYDLN